MDHLWRWYGTVACRREDVGPPRVGVEQGLQVAHRLPRDVTRQVPRVIDAQAGGLGEDVAALLHAFGALRLWPTVFLALWFSSTALLKALCGNAGGDAR